MELTEKKIEQLKKQPIIETVITKSEDEQWVIHKTVITDIKPVSYYEMSWVIENGNGNRKANSSFEKVQEEQSPKRDI